MASRGSSKARSSAAALEQHCSSSTSLDAVRAAVAKTSEIRFIFNTIVIGTPCFTCSTHVTAHTHLNSKRDSSGEVLGSFPVIAAPCSWRALAMPAPLFKRLESHHLPTNCRMLPPGRPYHLQCPCMVNWYNCATQASRPLWQLQQASCGGSLCLW